MKNGLVNILRVGTAIGLAAGSMLFYGCATPKHISDEEFQFLNEHYNGIRLPIYHTNDEGNLEEGRPTLGDSLLSGCGLGIFSILAK